MALSLMGFGGGIISNPKTINPQYYWGLKMCSQDAERPWRIGHSRNEKRPERRSLLMGKYVSEKLRVVGLGQSRAGESISRVTVCPLPGQSSELDPPCFPVN